MHFILKTLKPTPFKTGCLVVFIAALLFLTFGDKKPSLLESLDNRITDAMFRWRGTLPTTNSAVIVDIDEKSLRNVGQWPWPRNKVAELINTISHSGSKVIGLDMIFAEADRTSPKYFIDELKQYLPIQLPLEEIEALKNNEALDHDLVLGDALANSSSVLGYVFQMRNDGLKTEKEKPFPTAFIHLNPKNLQYEDINLFSSYRAIVNFEDIAQARSEGFFNVAYDEAGIVRKMPLFIKMDNIPYPSLALEMIRIGLKEQKIIILTGQQQIYSNKGLKKGIFGVSIADKTIPTDNYGQVSINFRGPEYTFPYISAFDILEGRELDKVKDKYVLIGTSAAGLRDLRATPFSSRFPGVEAHANLIDNFYANDFFTYDILTERGLTLSVIIFGGIFLSALLAFTGPLAGGLGGILVIEATIIGNYLFYFRNNEIVGMTYPLFTVFMVFLVVTLFNYFFEGREKRFISNAFGHYVSPDVVSRLAKNHESLSLSGEQKNLTVLFSDIRGFTSISEHMTSEELGRFMNEYLTEMSTIIMGHSGTVDKYIGDAIMAIWGAPLADEDHAANTVRTAFHMMERLHKLQPGWEKQALPFIDIGIGINTGIMSVGNFGSDQRFDYTVMGDNVNLASRLEGANKTYGTNIIISEFTKDALGEGFYCRFLDMVRVKGKKLPVKIYEPLCEEEPDESLKEEVARFEEAIEAYQHRLFDDALVIFQELLKTNPIKLYELYIDRIKVYLESPPPDDWDGSFTFTTK